MYPSKTDFNYRKMISILCGILLETNSVNHSITMAKGISDFGFITVVAGIFLTITMLLWFGAFSLLKKMISDLIKGNKEMMDDLLHETRRQNDMLNDISEGLRSETRERLKAISGSFFDLAVYKIMALIKRVKKENHIADRDSTVRKIRKSVGTLHSDRKSKFDNFTYRGKKLSEYVNPEWVDMVSEVVEKEVYDEDPNDDRAFTNVKNAYDEVKIDFYDRLKAQ